MNKLALLTTIIPFVITLQACKSNTTNKNVSIVDSVTVVKNTSAKLNIVAEKVDVSFVSEAANSGVAEVELGRLARQKGSNKRVKKFGMLMIAEHSKINNKIKGLASAKNIHLEIVLGVDKQNEISTLSKKSGNDFDKAYINNMIDDYKKDISTFESAAKDCVDPDVKLFAVKTLPVLQAHFDAINAINDSME
ncbi:DUF4142 domain-containing protein [Mucilaginibacter sp.]|uniref:DUF4142 domain-containing protein n=1 Tax=Mucilaginibacter sp. TaxID=1882438 RepID=UPI0026085A2E|nr:DUF4142 domain-containing protein [Mucilaginibacter sp.]